MRLFLLLLGYVITSTSDLQSSTNSMQTISGLNKLIVFFQHSVMTLMILHLIQPQHEHLLVMRLHHIFHVILRETGEHLTISKLRGERCDILDKNHKNMFTTCL